MLTIEADIYEYVRMSYVDKNILGPLVHMWFYSMDCAGSYSGQLGCPMNVL